MSTKTEVFDFKSKTGEKLSGRLELPCGEIQAVAIFAHCFTCSKNIIAASHISRALAASGFAVLRFDFTGIGNSDGDFANTSFSSNVNDLLAAADALKAKDMAPTLLVGHSLGGAAVLVAAPQIDSVKAVASIAAPSDPSHVKHLFEGDIPKIDADGRAEVKLGGRAFTISKEFIDDLSSHTLLSSLSSMSKALLVFHSPVDQTVSIEHAANIYQNAKHPKSFVSLDSADHLLSNRADAQYVADTLAVWAARYIEAPESEEAAEIPDGVVLVEETGNGFQQRIRMSEHEYFADEPASVGGGGTGPNPYELLLSALGACTGMTLRMYANHKKWPLDKVEVRLVNEKIHAKDCEACESEKGKVDRIEIGLRLHGKLEDEQRARLLEIAHRCPVHRTIVNEKQIDVVFD